MVLGDTCTRACRFCNIKTGNPQGFTDPYEPSRVAESCQQMKLKYVVITMVDRDDMEDGGALHLNKVIKEIRKENPNIQIELLAGDFNAKQASLELIEEAQPEVFAHNLETIRRLTPRVRDARSNYKKSLYVLENFKKMSTYPVYTKRALMLGLGEELEEVKETLKDLRSAQVDFITIGQYMRPSKKTLSNKKWVAPQIFKELEEEAHKLGFLGLLQGHLLEAHTKQHISSKKLQRNSTPLKVKRAVYQVDF